MRELDGETPRLYTATDSHGCKDVVPTHRPRKRLPSPQVEGTGDLPKSRISIDPTLAEGLKGLEPGIRIMVIFHFHRSQRYALLQHPRGDEKRPQRGVFALRSPRRPNPIGVTVVDLISVEEHVLHVQGLDALNGTPVLEIKPA